MEVGVNFEIVLFILLSALISLITTESCEKQSSCSCKTSSGFLLDLSSLPQLTATGVGQSQITYQFVYQPCTPITNCVDGQADVAVCQKDQKGSSYCSGTHSTAVFTGDLKAGTLNIQYSCTTDIERSTFVNVVCGKDTRLEFVRDDSTQNIPPKGKYLLKLTTEKACVPGGLSPGSTLLLIFFILLIVYVIGGILFMKFMRGATGVEMVPNLEFWKGLPSLIKDGVLFTSRGCKADTTYSQI